MAAITGDEVQAVFKAFFDREIEASEVDKWIGAGVTLEGLMRGAIKSDEFMSRLAREHNLVLQPFRLTPEYVEHNRLRSRVPRELQVTPTPLKRVLLVGACLLAEWPDRLKEAGVETPIDHVLLSHDAPPVAPHPPEDYNYVVAQIANRAVFGDYAVLQWLRAGVGGSEAAVALLEEAKGLLDIMLDRGTAWRVHMPVFVTTLTPPQQEFNGRLDRGRGLDSILPFFERLNAYLRARVEAMDNVYLIDLAPIFASIGTRHILDDATTISTHASFLGDGFAEEDRKRLIPSRLVTQYYDVKVLDTIAAVWFEAEAMYRTLLQIDQVKMVCVDLDDTLWRGVLAEEDIDDIDPYLAREGWPLGVAEALAVLKRRGVLLCLVSKNTQERVRALIEKVYRGILALEDFAILKINWEPKAQNIAAAMAEANLLPRSVVFLDDNPAERAAVKAAFPDIRVIEAPHYYWRRILLWSAETQVPAITAESARRTEMVQAQVARESFRAAADHDEFLAGLKLRMRMAPVEPGSKRFTRALELINKSNQFNTTGRRWSAQELEQAAVEGLVASVAVSDRFTDYGETLIAVLRGGRIEQLAMSCRVVGLGVEIAAVHALVVKALDGRGEVVAEFKETDANGLARDLWSRCGFALTDGEWRASAPPPSPPHIEVENAL